MRSPALTGRWATKGSRPVGQSAIDVLHRSCAPTAPKLEIGLSDSGVSLGVLNRSLALGSRVAFRIGAMAPQHAAAYFLHPGSLQIHLFFVSYGLAGTA